MMISWFESNSPVNWDRSCCDRCVPRLQQRLQISGEKGTTLWSICDVKLEFRFSCRKILFITMLSALISRLVIIVFGLLYPAYNSFKAVRSKNVKEYTKWMIYWIVFSIFTAVEMVTDVFISWFPFYYEVKVMFVVWLLSPITKGAHILYTRVIHPQFMKHEKDIDACLEQVSERGYSSLLELGTKGLDRIVTGIATGAIKAQVMMEQIQEVKEAEGLQEWEKRSTSCELKRRTSKKRQRKSSLGVTQTDELPSPESPEGNLPDPTECIPGEVQEEKMKKSISE